MPNIELTTAASVATILSFLLAVIGFMKYKVEKKNKELFERKYEELESLFFSLRDSSAIVNTFPKDRVRTTTVEQFVLESKEGDLAYGDNVVIATNDLKYYDLLPEYIDVLIKNIKKGVLYKYYIPDDADLRSQAKLLCKSIIDKVGYDKGQQILKNISFHRTNIHTIYNIAVVSEKGKNKCYWYFAFSPDQEGDNLCIVTFKDYPGSSITKMMAKIAEGSFEERDILLF